MVWLFIIIGLTIIFFATSLRHIPAQPPHIAVVTILGKRQHIIKKEGYRLFPFYPFIYNAILIDMTKKNQDLSPQTVRTCDLAEVQITVSLTWTPNEAHAIEYLNQGGENGIRNILSDMVRERLRQWAIAANRGPQTWVDLLQAQEDATAMLIREIAGLSANSTQDAHDKIIQRIRVGNGVAPIEQLGITLNRLNITEIKPLGKLALAAERLVIEQQDMKGIHYVYDQIPEIMKKVGCSEAEAREILQTERGKVAKKIQEIKGGVSADTVKAVEKLIFAWQKRKD